MDSNVKKPHNSGGSSSLTPPFSNGPFYIIFLKKKKYLIPNRKMTFGYFGSPVIERKKFKFLSAIQSKFLV